MKPFLKTFILFLAVSLSIGLLISSCAEESDCSTAGRPTLKGNFKQLNELGRAVADTVDWLTIRSFGTDSILLNAQQSLSMIMLPLRYTADSTVMVFQFDADDPAKADTVIFRHTNTPSFISVECGFEVKQALDQSIAYTRHCLDSIYVHNNASTNTDGAESLQLFLLPDTD